jgi:hypothetical protein
VLLELGRDRAQAMRYLDDGGIHGRRRTQRAHRSERRQITVDVSRPAEN